jgi:protein-S-isoprenylcysteine O-methyltransferase Ste14
VATASRREARARAWHLASKVVLVAVYATFAIAHLNHWRQTGEPSGLGLVITEGMFATLFLLRRAPSRSSSSPADWVFAVGGSWLIVFSRPSGPAVFGLSGLYGVLQVVFTAVSVVSLFFLGRSFGVVAADRGVKTGGTYRLVRHPVYAAYLFTEIGYLLQNPSAWNLGLFIAANACQIGRIRAEERILRGDPAWVAYAEHVRYRLIPGIY